MGTYIHTFWQVLNVYGTIFHVWRFSNMEIQFYDGAFCVYNKNQKISKWSSILQKRVLLYTC